MNKIRIATIVLAALSLLNFIVGGIIGLVFPSSESKKIFIFIFLVCIVAAIVCLLCDRMTLRQAEAETEYKVLKLRKGRLVREPRRMEHDNDGLRALQMGISGWVFSLMVPLFAFGMVWPDTFWLLSFNVLWEVLVLFLVAMVFVIEIIIANRKRKKGETL